MSSFDDWFSTKATSEDDLPDLMSHDWYKLFRNSSYQYIEDENDSDYSPSDEVDAMDFVNRQSTVTRAMENDHPITPLPTSTQPSYPLGHPVYL